MPEITFIFGPNDSFFFDCPKTWKFHGIPGTLRQLFNSSMAPAWRIAQPYCVALAPAPKSFKSAEPLWYIGCKTLSGEDKLFYSQTHFEACYADLAKWTKSMPNAPRLSFVTFGPNLSYFACAPGHGSIWAGIPSELEDKVRKNSSDTPSCVGLGKHNAWVVVYPSGHMSWNMQGHYTGLEQILKETTAGAVEYVAISPYHKEHYFIAFRDKSIKYNFKGAPKEWMELMTEVFNAWAAERIEKQSLQMAQPYAQQNLFMQQQIAQQPHAQPLGYPPQGYPQQYQQYQAAYNYPVPAHSPAQQPAHPVHSPGLPPGYTSPVHTPATPISPYGGYIVPNGGAVEMPAEMPGATLMAAATPVPVRSASTDKRKKFLSKLF